MKLENTKILLTGSSGRLGKHLVPLLEKIEGVDLSTPSSKVWDITSPKYPDFLFTWHPDVIIHAGAYTNVPEAQRTSNKVLVYETNVVGSERVKHFANLVGAKVVYISTDYAENPDENNFYTQTKLDGEKFGDMVIRTSFKNRGTWGENALKKVFHPVHTNADWTDIIASKVLEAIKKFDAGIIRVGTEPKTLLDLARQEYPEVETIPGEEADRLLGYDYPRDCRMNLSI